MKLIDAKCDHGLGPSDQEAFGWAGAVSRCDCCLRSYSHFNPRTPNHCNQCGGEEPDYGDGFSTFTAYGYPVDTYAPNKRLDPKRLP